MLLPGFALPQAGSPDSLLSRAISAYAEGDFPRTAKLLAARAEYDSTGGISYYIGSAYAALNDLHRALPFLYRATNLAPSHTGYRMQLARTLAATGNTDGAILEFRNLLALDSTSVPALQGLGLLAMEQREFRSASDRFRRILVLNPRDFQAAFSLGQTMVQLGETDSAISFLAASLTMNPTFAPCLDLLGSIYYEQGKNRDALRLYRRATLHHPWNSDFWYKQGLCLERLEDHAGAVESFGRAVRLDPAHESAHAHLGQAYYHRGFLDSSAIAYRRAAELDPENPVLHLNEGLALSRLDSVTQAESAFKRAIRHYEPESIGRAYMHLGALYYNAERYSDARRAYDLAVKFEPENSEAHFFLALSHERRKNYSAAVLGYRRFLRLAGNDPAQKKRAEMARDRLRALEPTLKPTR
jgi:tetratricopeptide (TPR) repeat protein